MSSRGNIASIGHSRLTLWGDRRDSLGKSSTNPLGSLLDGGRAGEGTGHSDPTMACQIRDEPVYAVERAVCQIKMEDPDIANLLFDHYYWGYAQRELALRRRITQARIQSMLLSGQSQVGAILSFGPKPQHVGDRRTAATRG